MTKYLVRAQIVNSKWEIKIVERSFKTEIGREAWIVARELDGTLHRVLAYSEV